MIFFLNNKKMMKLCQSLNWGKPKMVVTVTNAPITRRFVTFLFVVINFIMIGNVFAKSEHQMPPTAVEVIKVQAIPIHDQITATGSLVAAFGIVVKPEIAGRITKIYFKSGDRVKAGSPLIEINPDIIKAQLAQAKAELKSARMHFNRVKKVHDAHMISDIEYDNVKAKFETSKARVEEYQAKLAQTIVSAPFNGRLGISHVNLGQYVVIGQDIVSLQALNPIYVDFTIPEMDVSKVVVGQNVNVTSSVYPQKVFSGVVSAIDPLINKNSRSLAVRATVANDEEKLLPGAFADVVLFTGGQMQLIKVPQIAIIHEPNENFVYKIIDGKVKKTAVVTGKIDTKDVVIESGLQINDVIVIKGQMQIKKDGDPVMIVSTSKA